MRSARRKDNDGFQQKVVEVIGNYLGIEFAPFWHLRFQRVDGRTVAVIDVDRSPHEVFLRDGDKTEFYARVGSTTQPLDVDAATSYISMHWST